MFNFPRRRARRSGIDRLLRGLVQAGKYSLPGVVVSLAGCVPPPNIIGVSPDGKYIVLPVNDAGVAVSMDDASHIIRIDLKTQDIATIGGIRHGAFWMNVAGDTIAYGLLAGNTSSVVIHRGTDEPVTIESALFPTLSPDGTKLVYSEVRDLNQSEVTGKMMIRDIKSGETKELAAEGVAPEFSPDGKRLLYVAKNKGGNWAVFVMEADGKSAKALATIDSDMGGIFRPRWVDNGNIVFRSVTPTTGEDGELFTTDLEGKSQPLTENDTLDVLPVFAGKDRIIWQAPGTKEKAAQEVAPLWISEKVNGKWSSRELGLSVFAFSVVGDELYFATLDQGAKKIALKKCPIADPTKVTDLTPVIEKKVQNLPKSKLRDN